MKIKTNTLFKTISTFLILLALTFSTNMNASSTSMSTIPASMNPVFSNMIAISGNWWQKKNKKKKRCRRCGSSSCRGKCRKKRGHTDSVPLDGGLGILLLGGAAFGVRKLLKNKNDKL
ncbi:hypothetical protein Q4Q39_19105 [Flavivirga amylovorans]|uniref:LPXTG cell wall anchor domain-containing protein n=1 Tax=Flavivirga amylovorans TaxID=870486 RepID=A0ABT8X690_9FLAO|nr:hypothetical protein [Flavivirga amylovorans]MDO5989518.1 hypothetical protein [Flavivirga amylovorans]